MKAIARDIKRVAQATLICLRRTVLVAMSGINFLSGGQSGTTATANLYALNATAKKQPWVFEFSYGRALQASVLSAWRGEAANQGNSAATQGKYTVAMENE